MALDFSQRSTGTAPLDFSRRSAKPPAKRDPRRSEDYAAERRKADERERKLMPRTAFGAATQGLEPLPVLDEIGGALKGVGSYIAAPFQGLSAAEGADRAQAVYLATKDAANEGRRQRQQQFPVSSTVGGLLSGFAAGPVKGLVAKAPAVSSGALGFLKNNLKAAGVGGAYAGAYGFADSEGMERFGDAAKAVPGGLLAGSITHGGMSVAAPVVKLGAGAVRDVVRTATRKPPAPGVKPQPTPKDTARAENAVRALAERKGLTPEGVRQIADENFAGKPVTAAEIMGREGVGQLAATARRGGDVGDDLETLLVQRQRGVSERIMQDFSDDLGVTPSAATGDVQSMVRAGREAAAPLYDEAYAVGGVDDPRLDILRERPSMRSGMSRARTIAAEEGVDPTELGFRTVQTPETKTVRMLDDRGRWVQKAYETGEPGATQDLSVQVENPTARTWDYVKRALDDQLEGYRDPISRRLNLDEMGRAKLNTLNEFRGILREVNPKYGAALDQSGDYLSLIEAMSTAKGKTLRGTVGDFGKAWASAKTPAAKDAFRAQIAQDVLDAANSGLLRGGKFLIPGAQQKLELAFGREGAQRFLAKMQAEAALARTGGRMMPGAGSPTDELGAAGAESAAALEGAGRVAGKAARGQWVSAIADGTAQVIAYARTSGTPVQVRDEYGRILMMGADEFADWLGAQSPQAMQRIAVGVPSGLLGGQVVGMASQ